MTNYEKIKNMSIEEMAKFLRRRSEFDIEFESMFCDMMYSSKCLKTGCQKCYIKWLESEVTENE